MSIYIKTKLFVKDCLENIISPKTSSVFGPASFKILLPRRTKKTLFFVLKVYEQSEVNNGTKRRRIIFFCFFLFFFVLKRFQVSWYKKQKKKNTCPAGTSNKLYLDSWNKPINCLWTAGTNTTVLKLTIGLCRDRWVVSSNTAFWLLSPSPPFFILYYLPAPFLVPLRTHEFGMLARQS